SSVPADTSTLCALAKLASIALVPIPLFSNWPVFTIDDEAEEPSAIPLSETVVVPSVYRTCEPLIVAPAKLSAPVSVRLPPDRQFPIGRRQIQRHLEHR